jgi:hypothetical protein
VSLLLQDRAGAQATPQVPSNRPKYVKLDLGSDTEGVLEKMLQDSGEDQELQKTIEKLFEKVLKEYKNDPKKLEEDAKKLQGQLKGWDKEQIKKLQDKVMKNPLVKQHLKDWLDQPDLKDKFKSEQMETLKKKLLEEFKSPPKSDTGGPGQQVMPPPWQQGGPPPHNGPPGTQPGQPVPPVTPAPKADTSPPDEALADWTKDLLKDLEHSGVKDLILESDALQKLILDLDNFSAADGEQGPLGFVGEDLAKWLGDQSGGPWDGSLPPMPDWPAGSGPLPKPPTMPVPQTGWMPPLPAVSPGLAVPAVAGTVPLLLIFFLVVLAGVVFWLICKAAPWNVLRRSRVAVWQLGPWPVDPSRVSTPGELILAFNYLSLLRFGPDAAGWNHSTAADHLGPQEQPAQHQAAGRLATLYEQARYAPAVDTLSTDDIRQARQDLGSLGAGTR